MLLPFFLAPCSMYYLKMLLAFINSIPLCHPWSIISMQRPGTANVCLTVLFAYNHNRRALNICELTPLGNIHIFIICIYDTVIRVCTLVRCMANLSIRGVFDLIQEWFVQIQNDSIQFTMRFQLIDLDKLFKGAICRIELLTKPVAVKWTAAS